MKSETSYLAYAAVFAMAALCAPQIATAQTAEGPQVVDDPSTSGDEIIVTAQKREQSANDVPVSLSVASGEQLTKLGITDPSQLSKVAPGFVFTEQYSGYPTYTIRGVGFQDTALAAPPTVSVYQDEVPLPYSAMTSGMGLDVERVEVLKGPQGTLFGSNATGGAVNYIANKPTATVETGADINVDHFGGVGLTAYASGPLAGDTLKGRLAVQSRQGGAWQRSYTRADRLGDADFLNGRVSLLFTPGDRARFFLTVAGYRDKGDTQAPQLFGRFPLNPTNGMPPAFTAYPLSPAKPRAADWNQCINTDPLIVPNGASLSCESPRKDNSLWMASLRSDFDVTDGVKLTSLTAYEKYKQHETREVDGTTVRNNEYVQDGNVESFYQELRAAGDFGGRGSWVLGGNYMWAKSFNRYFQTTIESSVEPLFGFLILGPTAGVTNITAKTWAGFGNVEYPLSDTITVQGGARYTTDRRDFSGCTIDGGDGSWALASQIIQNFLQAVNNPANGVQGQGINVGPGRCASTGPGPTYHPADPLFTDTLKEDNVSWRAGINWTPRRDALVYVNVSKGYKSGSFPNTSTSSYKQLRPVTQESVLAFEAGAKLGFGRAVQLNAAAFYYDYKNKQVLGSVPDSVFGALPALVNVPKSRVVGFEADAVLRPIDGLTLRPSMSFQDSKVLGSFVNTDVFNRDADFGGQAFPNAPRWQANGDAEYTWGIGSVSAFVGANVSYTSSTNEFFYNDDPTTQAVPANTLRLRPYTLLDLRAGIDTGHVRISVWGRNVTNQYYWTSAHKVNDALVRYAGRPATFGVSVSLRN